MALGTYLYRIETGKRQGKQLLVRQWVRMNGKQLSEAKARRTGTRWRLRIESMSAHPELKSIQQFNGNVSTDALLDLDAWIVTAEEHLPEEGKP
ncbi:MAG: hypothetical protein ACLFVU_01040 [Phycisphaerae bacterium]